MYANFTEETATGTGDVLTLTGATTGNIPFSASFADGDSVAYVVEDSAGVKVAGIGTYSAGTITRNDTWNYNGSVVDKNPSTNIALSGTNTVRCDAIDESIQPITRPRSNYYYQCFYAGFGNNSNIAVAADTLYIMPFYVRYAGYYDAFRIFVHATGTATKARCGIYKCNADQTVGSKIAESADISVSTTGEKISSFSATYFGKGFYYVVFLADGTVTVNSQNSLSTSGLQSLWGHKNPFSTRMLSHDEQQVTPSWTVLPSIVVPNPSAGDENDAPSISLVAV